MTQPLAILAQLLSSALLVACLVASAACHRPDDCTLYDTCPGSLLERAKTLARDNAHEPEHAFEQVSTCQQCLQRHCAAIEEECSTDFACNFASRCKLAASPLAYQKCLRDLYEGGLTRGDEGRFPWEGQEDVGRFGICFQQHCRAACIADPFHCGERSAEYRHLDIEVALRDYPFFRAQRDVQIRACRDIDSPSLSLDDNSDCTPWETTDHVGRASFPGAFKFVLAERLYFEIEEREGLFPKTFYYPGRLGDDGLQLVTIYVIVKEMIQAGNKALGRGDVVLQDSAQSLILSDSCVWEEISADNLTISVGNAEIPQCHEEPCRGADCRPCVWYAKDRFPSTEAQQTDGTGAGVVGLAPNFYTIDVKRGKDELVSRREWIRMEAGALTIVRTWPLDSRPAHARPSATDATP